MPGTPAGEGQGGAAVLDYIGQQRREFRFDAKLRVLTGLHRKALEKAVEEGFPFLPSGSQIILDWVAQQTVLENIREQLRVNRKQLVAEVRSYGEPVLEDYLRESGRDLPEVYRRTGDSWTSLIREAGLVDIGYAEDAVLAFQLKETSELEEDLMRRMTAMLCIDDPERAETYTKLVSEDAPRYAELSDREQILARMLFFALWPNGGGHKSYNAGLQFLRSYPLVCAEIQQLAALGVHRSRYAPKGLGRGLQQVPLYSHATYRREEVLAALGYFAWGGKTSHREGVAWCA